MTLSSKLRQVRAIYWKDFFHIVTSPMFLFVAGACCLLWSVTFMRDLGEFSNAGLPQLSRPNEQGPNIYYTVFAPLGSFVNLLFLFIAPALTMRLISEERKLGTFHLLLSSPLSSTQIVLGKFLAGWSALGVLTLTSFLYVAFTAFFADFNWILPILAYFGIFLAGGIYTACGLFASSLSQSVVLSVILGLVLNLGVWFITQTSHWIDNAVLSSAMEFLSINKHLVQFYEGKFVISSAVFFIVLISFFVFLARQSIEILRWR